MKTAGMMASCFWVAALLLAMVTMVSAQESVSVNSVNGVSETASSVNRKSKGSTQIASDLWTTTPTAAEYSLMPPGHHLSCASHHWSHGMLLLHLFLWAQQVTIKRYSTVDEC